MFFFQSAEVNVDFCRIYIGWLALCFSLSYIIVSDVTHDRFSFEIGCLIGKKIAISDQRYLVASFARARAIVQVKAP